MKKTSIILLLIFIMCLAILTACNKTDTENNSIQTESDTSVPSAETADGTHTTGEYRSCELHHQDYHIIPGALIDHIGEERFYEWTELDGADQTIEGCEGNKTVYNCIKYFNIGRDELEEIYSEAWNTTVWDIDALCSEDVSVSDEFYRNSEYIDSVHEKRSGLHLLKHKISETYYSEWTAIHGNFVPGPKHSVKYLVELLDISREEMEDLTKAWSSATTYSYNVDVLYPVAQQEDTSGNGESSALTPIEEDALFCGIDDWYIE